ncbi:MAG: GIY-YIG nuclease family protein [Rudaea sp.]|nr:GIY-YIG nuclease family protein [Rudaea sp.]
MSDRVWFVYLLLCRNGHIYTGVTPDLERRITAHRNGKGAKFTLGNPPERVLAIKPFTGKIAAMRMEVQVKRMRRARKLELAAGWSIEHAVEELSTRLLPRN